MKRSNVIYMDSKRELLAELDKLRADIIRDNISGWGGMVRYEDGREVVYLGGTFKQSSDDRTRCVLKVSAAVALHDCILPSHPETRSAARPNLSRVI